MSPATTGELQKMGGQEERVSEVGRSRAEVETREQQGEGRFDVETGPTTEELVEGPEGRRQAEIEAAEQAAIPDANSLLEAEAGPEEHCRDREEEPKREAIVRLEEEEKRGIKRKGIRRLPR